MYLFMWWCFITIGEALLEKYESRIEMWSGPMERTWGCGPDRGEKELKWKFLYQSAKGIISLSTELFGKGTELLSNLKMAWPNFTIHGHFTRKNKIFKAIDYHINISHAHCYLCQSCYTYLVNKCFITSLDGARTKAYIRKCAFEKMSKSSFIAWCNFLRVPAAQIAMNLEKMPVP